jgi:hypothetical protein
MTTEGPVEVYAAKDLAEAHFVLNLLADAGVEATVVGEPLGAAVGELPPLVATPRVWVRAADSERSRPVVDEYRRHLTARAKGESMPSPGEESFCHHCGETVNTGLSRCPACGRDLDGGDE